ncbi:translocation/assembly module TamB domain-containing protein [Thiomicrorhabdus lithotrophica]|uniref:Translocation/assembly module TamB domain-containing protein n=1 Tax=Thiomicrorhabdus lithotrophica TaxID=2949997 RepID=A0ABY8C7A9_9GAMM|nr:translocation/assembly module TamB domain-containing protein [Thiomicrorhabdus lithotrophica]WEJ61789.1 translocation/assembly module TamB domain-containing protein [Thiomicrorhabdus lithotrophica]
MTLSKLAISKRFVEWLLIGILSLMLLITVLLTAVVSLALWHTNATTSILPYLSQWTDGQLQIESSEGRLIDGLTLQNIRFKNESMALEIQKVTWKWQLSQLFNRQIHFEKLHLTETKLRLISDEKQENKSSNTAPFEVARLLGITINIDEFKASQTSLEFDNDSPVVITHLSSEVKWKKHVLNLKNLITDYQQYQLQASSKIEILSADEFKGNLKLKILGHEQFPDIRLVSDMEGSLKQLKFSLDTHKPYRMQSVHTLTLEESLLKLDSQWKALSANLSEQWKIEQVQGNTSLVYNQNSQQVYSKGTVKLDLADKPQVQFDYQGDYSTKGIVTFDINALTSQMGSVHAQGQANSRNSTINIDVSTKHLNLQWLAPALNYQINSNFNWLLTDFEKRQSKLNIKQFDLAGLPEALAFNGLLNTQLNAQSKYLIKIESGKLKYASHKGKLNANITLNQALSEVNIHNAKLNVGDNQIDLTGEWNKTFNLTLNGKLRRLEQLYKPLSGKINFSLNSKGSLDIESNGFDQAWSNLTLKAEQLKYQKSTIQSNEVFSLNSFKLDATVPLHKPEWTTANLIAKDLTQDSNTQQNKNLFSRLELNRQKIQKGLESKFKITHPEISIKAQTFESSPSFKQQKIALNRLDITQPLTGNWHLKKPSTIDWKAPYQFNAPETCLNSDQKKQAQFCFEAQNNQAKWSLQSLPFFNWIQPWLSESVNLQGRLNGEGSANWKHDLNLQQTLTLPQIDITITEQGYKIPILIRNWQTEIKLANNKAQLTSQAKINETGSLCTEINALNKLDWAAAKLDGDIHLQINEWPLSKGVLEILEFNKTELSLDSKLSGRLNALQHDTQTTAKFNLNLPLLGLNNQAFDLNAKLTTDTIDAKGTWRQTEQRQADLSVKLTNLKTQPKLIAIFKTDTIELLQTEFAHLNTSANMSVTLAENSTHIQGRATLHNSNLNLDAMPLHERTQTSDDEVLINEKGEIVQKPISDFKLSYDIKIGFGDQVKLNVRDAQTSLGGELQLIKQTDTPDIRAFGKVELKEGFINLDNRNQIQIAQSHFSFNGSLKNPTLDVNLFRLVDQTTARLNITGNATQPQFVFYSNPSLSQGRIINLMIFGRAGDLEREPNYESQVLSAFYKLGIQNNTPMLNTLTKTLGIEDVYFDVQNQKVSSLLVGRALTDKLYVRYAKDLTGQQSNAVQFFYQLTNKWLLKSNSGDNSSSVDLIYRLER